MQVQWFFLFSTVAGIGFGISWMSTIFGRTMCSCYQTMVIKVRGFICGPRYYPKIWHICENLRMIIKCMEGCWLLAAVALALGPLGLTFFLHRWKNGTQILIQICAPNITPNMRKYQNDHQMCGRMLIVGGSGTGAWDGSTWVTYTTQTMAVLTCVWSLWISSLSS